MCNLVVKVESSHSRTEISIKFIFCDLETYIPDKVPSGFVIDYYLFTLYFYSFIVLVEMDF